MSDCIDCGQRLDPVLTEQGYAAHPGCRQDEWAVDDALREALAARICRHAAARGHDRPQTVTFSGIGHPCRRRIGYEALGWCKPPRPSEADTDPLPALIGVGGHLVFAEAFGGDRQYLTEAAVDVDGVTGQLDLYDVLGKTIIDWKFVGGTRLRKYRSEGPSQQYRVQVNCYALGLERAGYEVERVAIAFVPRSGSLREMHVRAAPYDRQLALAALARLEAVIALAAALNVDDFPQRWALVKATPTDCAWCPWYRPYSTDLGVACPGDSFDRPATDRSIQSLLP
ncbi:MAG: hypothetical protein ACM4D3_07045 [Candidatus Sericytochromatia bacterium]